MFTGVYPKAFAPAAGQKGALRARGQLYLTTLAVTIIPVSMYIVVTTHAQGVVDLWKDVESSDFPLPTSVLLLRSTAVALGARDCVLQL